MKRRVRGKGSGTRVVWSVNGKGEGFKPLKVILQHNSTANLLRGSGYDVRGLRDTNKTDDGKNGM